MRFVVHVEFDTERRLYFAHESDIPGLTVEASSADQLMEIVCDAGPDLLGGEAAAPNMISRSNSPPQPKSGCKAREAF